MARLLLPQVAEVTLVRLQNERSADPADLARHFPGLPVRLIDSVADFRPGCVARPVLVTGSLFLVGEMLARGEVKRERISVERTTGNARARPL